jgi:hypothetical protein
MQVRAGARRKQRVVVCACPWEGTVLANLNAISWPQVPRVCALLCLGNCHRDRNGWQRAGGCDRGTSSS